MWTFNVSKVAKSITSALGTKSGKPGYVKATVVGYAGTMARYIRGGGYGRNLRVIEAMESGVGVKSEGGRGAVKGRERWSLSTQASRRQKDTG